MLYFNKKSYIVTKYYKNCFIMNDSMVRIDLEYIIKTTPNVLFTRLSTANGLSEWFAEEVEVIGNTFIFKWEGSEQSAIQSDITDSTSVKYTWLEDDNTEGSWFEFTIIIEELTGDLALIVTDHTEVDDLEDTTELWNQQIETLKLRLGSS